MWSMNFVVAKSHGVVITARDLAFFAAALAMALLLGAYIDAVSTSVERGQRIRAQMKTAAAPLVEFAATCPTASPYSSTEPCPSGR